MQNILTDLLTVQALSKEIHWNMQGRGFIAVHKYLDEVDASCHKYVDTLAEHMVATMEYGLPKWELKEFETFPQVMIKGRGVEDGLKALVPTLETFVETLDEYLANETDDPAGDDYVTQCLQDFSKHLWFLSAELG